MKHEGWTPGELTPSQLEGLALFEGLLLQHAVPRGMVAFSDRGHLRTRHILDSLRGVPFIPGDAHGVVDIGSGAGLPGLPIAIVLPHVEFTLSEPRQARAAFLELAVSRLGLKNTRVFPGPVQDLAAGFDRCLARGFGDAHRTWEIAQRLLRSGGQLLYWAGGSFALEDVPSGVSAREAGEATLESGGPIVIMARE